MELNEDTFSKFLEEIKRVVKEEHPCQTPYVSNDDMPIKAKRALNDIDKNRNHAWAVEMYNRNKDNLDKIAIKYRGNEITYKELFTKAFKYAKSLKELGFKKGDEIPICITNIPEFAYLFLASSLIGATPNIVGTWFDSTYLTSILEKTKSKTIFIDDISYEKIRDSISNSGIENIVCFSLTDSLKEVGGRKVNPYESIDSRFHQFTNNVATIKSDFDGNVMNSSDFEQYGDSYQGKVFEHSNLDDISTITYTSGTTKPGFPKGVKQSNRSYITLSRFKESDVSGMPTMKDLTVLAHIPTYTHMELSVAMSDAFYCGCTLAMEPFYSYDFFPYSMLINEPNFVPASVGFYGNLCKKLNFDPEWKYLNMPYLMIPTITGEGCSPGEEKFFNMTARKHKFGTAKLPFPLSPVTFSIGGGTTESSGILVTLYKSLQEKKLNHLIKKETLGLTPLKFADIEVLDENGHYCQLNEPGLLVANNPCQMIGYTDEKLNETVTIVDAYGKKWSNLGTYSYKSDNAGRIKMKGRMNDFFALPNGEKIPFYQVEDTVLSDTKNIMSCSVVRPVDEDALVCHVEMQPLRQNSNEHVIQGIVGRIESIFPQELQEQLYIRFRSNEESFPLDPSGKRSTSTLRREGVDEYCIPFSELSATFSQNSKDNQTSINKKLQK